MTNDEKAKQLLVSSYLLSARRINDALEGRLSIKNSRPGTNPHNIAGEVIGLCGQGGRHPYFRIPINVLKAAVDRIEQTARRGYQLSFSIEQMAEEIGAACQDLRQQTYFDIGTGCANDALPSMVPLLPPEEIWSDGQELPMDVWRLVCFEFDLVSSAVSSQVPVEDFAFSSITQSALAFRFLINQLGNRWVNFEVTLNNIPPQWISSRSSSFMMSISLPRIFFEAGSLLTPLATQNFIKWYGAIRYAHWIDSGVSELRVRDEFDRDSVDSRYRGLFAEETAIGLMAIVLSEVFNASPINNTVEVLPSGSLIRRGQQIADFIAQTFDPSTSQKTTIIAESKGSLGRPINKARYVRAKQQVTATNILFSGSTITLPLTFGSRISFSKQPDLTRCHVVDPDANFEYERIYVDPVEAWRVAYAKALTFVGLERSGQQVLHGIPAEGLRAIDFDRERDRKRSDRDFQRLKRAATARQRFDMELLLDVGTSAVSLDSRVLAILRRGIDQESANKLSVILNAGRGLTHDRLRGSSFRSSLGIGCLSYSDLDEPSSERTPER